MDVTGEVSPAASGLVNGLLGIDMAWTGLLDGGTGGSGDSAGFVVAAMVVPFGGGAGGRGEAGRPSKAGGGVGSAFEKRDRPAGLSEEAGSIISAEWGADGN